MANISSPSADAILTWYDRNARDLPWRVPPHESRAGVLPDPYHVWLSEVMLQQTTVAAVTRYFLDFTGRWPRVRDLAEAEDEAVMGAWAGLGYYARARNLLKCARIVSRDLDGRFPDTEAELLKLPGIGPYTAAAIAAIAFGRQAVVLDGNIERVMARVYRVETPLPGSKEKLRGLARGLTPVERAGDYAQAVMDLGATICTPRSPACGICPWMESCEGRLAGVAETLPRKSPKAAKPVRFGVAYLGIGPEGAVALETRPESGLLGGMLGLPGTDWREDVPEAVPPVEAEWREVPGEVRHTFTHFHLRLKVFVGRVDALPRDRLRFYPGDDDLPDRLPTVMRKALRLGLSAVEDGFVERA